MSLALAACLCWGSARGAESGTLPVVDDVELQPLASQARRVCQALELAGSPLTAQQQAALNQALADQDGKAVVRGIQAVFDPLCLAGIEINPESRVKAIRGPAPAKLVQHGWRVFLLKVQNNAGVTAPLRVSSPQAAPQQKRSTASPEPAVTIRPADVADRWLDIAFFDRQPLEKSLSGLALEYRLVELYSRDAGQREARLLLDVGQGTQDLGFRNEISLLFDCQPAVKVALDVLDDDGRPTIGWFVFRDQQRRVYPAMSRRQAPDFFFHPQVYRANGETVLLPPGRYQVTFGRGPEYREQTREMTVPAPESAAAASSPPEIRERFALRRWIKVADHGWYSGDHHVHAAGCAHYESPEQGVTPADMLRHIEGEDLNVGCVLAWGPCWYFQKQFFAGKVDPRSTAENLMRFDVEVSGFPSSHAGHLCLLGLTEDDYPGTKRIEDWPTWDLPILRWAREQGAVVGFAHSGWGLQTKSEQLPADEVPRFDGIGANEYIVDVTHGACDFISAVDTPAPWELSIWYHTLNCGFTTRISGETDFPCIYGERVGLGRSYVQLEPGQPLDYPHWLRGIRDGRSYVSDGRSHLLNFTVSGLAVGQVGDGPASLLRTTAGNELTVLVQAAALLADKPQPEISRLPSDQKPYWHLERARIGKTNRVPVELIVNGRPVATQELVADGRVQPLEFREKIERSSWVALRIYRSSHTNPVFVEVNGKPIRASRRSAQWCLDGVDACWSQKRSKIRPAEQAAAAEAYEAARQAYRRILTEMPAD